VLLVLVLVVVTIVVATIGFVPVFRAVVLVMRDEVRLVLRRDRRSLRTPRRRLLLGRALPLPRRLP